MDSNGKYSCSTPMSDTQLPKQQDDFLYFVLRTFRERTVPPEEESRLWSVLQSARVFRVERALRTYSNAYHPDYLHSEVWPRFSMSCSGTSEQFEVFLFCRNTPNCCRSRRVRCRRSDAKQQLYSGSCSAIRNSPCCRYVIASIKFSHCLTSCSRLRRCRIRKNVV